MRRSRKRAVGIFLGGLCASALILTGCGEKTIHGQMTIDMQSEKPESAERSDWASDAGKEDRADAVCDTEEIGEQASPDNPEENEPVWSVELVMDLYSQDKSRDDIEKYIAECDSQNDAERLLDDFLRGKVEAQTGSYRSVYDIIYEDDRYYDQIIHDGKADLDLSNLLSFRRVDLDNDGEMEQLLSGLNHGGYYFDAREGEVYLLAQWEGTAGILSYTYFEDAFWIVHRDTSHGNREVYWLTKYDGSGKIEDEFELSAWYPGSTYDKDSDFTYRDKKISMEEFEQLRGEVLEGMWYGQE